MVAGPLFSITISQLPSHSTLAITALSMPIFLKVHLCELFSLSGILFFLSPLHSINSYWQFWCQSKHDFLKEDCFTSTPSMGQIPPVEIPIAIFFFVTALVICAVLHWFRLSKPLFITLKVLYYGHIL